MALPTLAPLALLVTMLAASLLVKKRDGHALTDDEIRFLVDGFCRGEVADYQMSALAMAICLQGMEPREITTLTLAMLESGDRLPRPSGSATARPRVDKHSTGGLGDKVSLILAPLLACQGVDVPMVSGRGLGLSGGTLDKLEAIEGFDCNLDIERSSQILEDVGAFIISASERIAPADRRLYSLRDVTGTVESVPLITASILSKKLAANLDALVMDVKVGDAAFMKTLEQAKQLADSIVRVGGQAGMPTTAILSDMDQPLGAAVGNAVEVNESIDVLRGEGPAEVRSLTIELCADVLVAVKIHDNLDAAREALERSLDNGQAMERFEKMIHAQSGNLNHPISLGRETVIESTTDGFASSVDCETLGETVVELGGGRRKTGDEIDHSVGLTIHSRIGDPIQQGQPLLTVFSRDELSSKIQLALQSAVNVSSDPVDARPLIIERR